MITRYLETFDRPHSAPEKLIPDLMRHLHARQHLGKAVVLCDDPVAMQTLAVKQWRKLSRVLQQRRAFATNAVEILKYTYTITQMQHARFSAGKIHESPEETVYFELPGVVQGLPADCLSVYLMTKLPAERVKQLVRQLPDLSLLVDYTGCVAPDDGLRFRSELERNVRECWNDVKTLLESRNIDMRRLSDAKTSSEAVDDAVDDLLGLDAEFLFLARDFQRKLDLARPLRSTPKIMRDQYEAFIVLAHRVQTFSTGGFSPQFLRTYADDTFFFNDRQRAFESFAAALRRHEAAGRANIVRLMMRFGQSWMPVGID